MTNNCTGAKKKMIETDVTKWGCFQQVAEVLGEDDAQYELGKVAMQAIAGDDWIDLEEDKELLTTAFIWESTNQGNKFWSDICEGIKPEGYDTTPDVPPTPEVDKKKTSLEISTESFAQALGVTEDELMEEFNKHKEEHSKPTLGELIEDLAYAMPASGVQVLITGDGKAFLTGEKIPTVDVTKLEAEEVDKVIEALVMCEGLFVEYNGEEE